MKKRRFFLSITKAKKDWSGTLNIDTDQNVSLTLSCIPPLACIMKTKTKVLIKFRVQQISYNEATNSYPFS